MSDLIDMSDAVNLAQAVAIAKDVSSPEVTLYARTFVLSMHAEIVRLRETQDALLLRAGEALKRAQTGIVFGDGTARFALKELAAILDEMRGTK